MVLSGPFPPNSPEDHVGHYNEKSGPNTESDSYRMISYLQILSQYVKREEL